jgi:Tol biopolymer transport system component
MPRWSHDGRRILFDTTESQWQWPVAARLMAIEAVDGRPEITDLGAGNAPTFSPDDKRIAFLIHQGHPGAAPGAKAGIWVMQADGSGRRYVGGFGAPYWSPDGREFLLNSYTLPTESTVISLDAKEAGIVTVPGHFIFSWPSWAGPGTLVSALATDGDGDQIVLLDVRKPDQAKIIEVLWKRGADLDVAPRWPNYRPETRQCFFVGEEPKRRKIYSVRRGESLRARSMGVVELTRPGQHQQLAALSLSPDGRYLLFSANRPDRE